MIQKHLTATHETHCNSSNDKSLSFEQFVQSSEECCYEASDGTAQHSMPGDLVYCPVHLSVHASGNIIHPMYEILWSKGGSFEVMLE